MASIRMANRTVSDRRACCLDHGSADGIRGTEGFQFFAGRLHMTRPALALLLCLFASLATDTTDAVAADSAADDATYGAGAVLGTLLYAPLKTGFCIGGGVTSALALPFGGTQTAGTIASAAC